MGYKIYFDTYKQMMHFINYTSEFNDWECKKLTLTNKVGNVLDVNTLQYNTQQHIAQYVKFADVKQSINDFASVNANSAIKLDLKLIYPKELLNTIDVNNTFLNVYVAFYSYNDENNYMNCGFEEFGGSMFNQATTVEESEEAKDILFAYSNFVAIMQRKYDLWKVYYDTYL